MKYFLVGDLVNVPKLKMIGHITDKKYKSNMDEMTLMIHPNIRLTRETYNPKVSILYGNYVEVNYSAARSMKSIDIYKNKLTESIPTMLLFPNMLKKRDIIKGTKIKIVDNYFIERMINYNKKYRLYAGITLSYLTNREFLTLTGKYNILGNGELEVECQFSSDVNYFVYAHSIQVIKKVNIFKRLFNPIKRWWNSINNKMFIYVAIGYFLVMSIVLFINIISK